MSVVSCKCFILPVYLTSAWRGFPWNWVSALGVKKLELTTGPRKKFDDIFTRLDIIHERDRQTDGYRPTAKIVFTHSVARKNDNVVQIKTVNIQTMSASNFHCIKSKLTDSGIFIIKVSIHYVSVSVRYLWLHLT